MSDVTEKSSADIEREIESDRQRLGDRLDAIQERMSPGQLIDEALAYVRHSGGAEFVGNLGQTLKTNPLPVALMGVSLAWLMAKPTSIRQEASRPPEDSLYPLYQAQGSVRRIGPPEAEGSLRYSHFADSSGKRFKALTDDAGRRAGHFMDEAGKTYRGFADGAGRQMDQIADETGAVLDAASGWVSATWGQVKDTASMVGDKASNAVGSLSDRSAAVGTSVQEQAGRLNEMILKHFRDQPLVGGALAFAAGAAIGAALPHTEQEDEILGETADAARDRIASEASAVADHGKAVATEVYDKAISVASDIHDAAREQVSEEVADLKDQKAGQRPAS